ncbi:winged helix-turn-helix domain-containing protein [Fictibacillus halophilus]|uniref:winged helix-turn-helix domain-containing protein n=1 Tax=Fictibacillus halophilus TaxID=1610490 RepID=UPI001CFAB5F8|nr:winged helix-turn-helix domain-containing protein [Fictibacillus halophilus]
MSKLSESLLRYYYLKCNMSIGDIADRVGVGKTTVSRHLQKLGIPTRGPKFTGGKKKVNEEYFDSYGPKQCYYASWINSDGCLYISKGTYSLELVVKKGDRDILEAFKNDVGSEHNIVETESNIRGKATKAIRLRIGSKKIIQSLMLNYGILPRKSLKEEFPWIPQKFVKDGIRGELDGDGSIYPEGKRLNVVFYGSEKKLSKINAYIHKNLNIKGSIYCTPIKNESLEKVLIDRNIKPEVVKSILSEVQKNYLYRLDFKKQDEVMKLLSWLYDDAVIYLKRKYDLFMNYKLNRNQNIS